MRPRQPTSVQLICSEDESEDSGEEVGEAHTAMYQCLGFSARSDYD